MWLPFADGRVDTAARAEAAHPRCRRMGLLQPRPLKALNGLHRPASMLGSWWLSATACCRAEREADAARPPSTTCARGWCGGKLCTRGHWLPPPPAPQFSPPAFTPSSTRWEARAPATRLCKAPVWEALQPPPRGADQLQAAGLTGRVGERVGRPGRRANSPEPAAQGAAAGGGGTARRRNSPRLPFAAPGLAHRPYRVLLRLAPPPPEAASGDQHPSI